MTLPKCQCIYAIINKKNNKVYVGSTNNLRKRSYEHKSKLKNGYHRNKKLQKDYDKYDKEDFKFKVLEKINENNSLTEKERYYIIKHFDKTKLYNIRGPYNLNEIKTERLIIQLTEEQKNFIENQSKETGMSQAEIVRRAINQYIVKNNN